MSKAEWQAHITEWRKSGKTQAAYAAEIGVSYKTFSLHVCKQRREGVKAVRFAQAVVKPAVAMAVKQPPPLELRLGKVRVRVPAGFDPVYLAEVLRAVGAP